CALPISVLRILLLLALFPIGFGGFKRIFNHTQQLPTCTLRQAGEMTVGSSPALQFMPRGKIR
ncbi:MAG: hypothetical protein AB7V46_20525, partial [Thermomicrobiales bacterium]